MKDIDPKSDNFKTTEILHIPISQPNRPQTTESEENPEVGLTLSSDGCVSPLIYPEPSRQ